MIDSFLSVSYGLGLNSSALLVGLRRRKIRPDAITLADTGGESDLTYAYYPIISAWLAENDMPPITVVRYVPKDFKNWPPYHNLEQNCLTNGTLPSLAFGFKSCSLKWKVAPQDAYLKSLSRVQAIWAAGGKVRKMIGYDAGPADERRRRDKSLMDPDKFEYEYPLVDWGWDRDRCALEIEKEGLPVPPKSSCFFCPAMKPAEVRALPAEKLRRIVIMEARAQPRLTSIEGLWRTGCKGTRGAEKRPGAITEFIREEGLLPSSEIDRLRETIPADILLTQASYATTHELPEAWPDYLSEVCHDGIPLPVLPDLEDCCGG